MDPSHERQVLAAESSGQVSEQEMAAKVTLLSIWSNREGWWAGAGSRGVAARGRGRCLVARQQPRHWQIVTHQPYGAPWSGQVLAAGLSHKEMAVKVKPRSQIG